MLALSIDISSRQHPSNKPSKTALFLLCITGSVFSPRTKQKQTLNQTRVRNGQVSTTSVIMKDRKTGNKLFLIKNSYEEDISWITRIHLGKKKARYGGLESQWWGNGDRQISGAHWPAIHPGLPAMFQASAGTWHIHTKGMCMFLRNDIQGYSLAHHTYRKLQMG